MGIMASFLGIWYVNVMKWHRLDLCIANDRGEGGERVVVNGGVDL